ncbi:MAG: flavodoxin family protein [Bacteroidota bacterium]
MNIGIVVHSQTGTTLRFGRVIAQHLQQAGHAVEMIELHAGEHIQPRAAEVAIANMPDPKRFDAMLFGGPVWAFAASPVIMACIKKMDGISGKKALPFATMGFPFRGMGGGRALAQMGKALAEKGAAVLPGAVVPKMFRNTARLMEEAAGRIPALFN